MKIGICAFPLYRGKETGRGLDRTFGEIADGFKKLGVKFHYYDLGFIPKEWQAVLKSWKYCQMLRRATDDIYLAVYPVAAIFPILLRKRPLVSGIHDMIPFHVFGYNNRVKYAFKRWCIGFAARRSDHIIVGLATTKKEIIEYFGIDSRKISVVPYGVDLKNYYYDRRIAKVKHRIAFLGEAKRAKGMDTVIEAFALILKKLPHATLALASSGSELEDMKNLAARLLPPKSYRFVGFVPENQMRQFYAEADVFLFPSRHGYGLPALEAMACGTPAIVGDTLDARDFFTDPDLLVKTGDARALARRSIDLLTNRRLYGTKCRVGLKKVSAYSWQETAKGYARVVSDYLCDRKSK